MMSLDCFLVIVAIFHSHWCEIGANGNTSKRFKYQRTLKSYENYILQRHRLKSGVWRDRPAL
jgi:hypothetical protein